MSHFHSFLYSHRNRIELNCRFIRSFFCYDPKKYTSFTSLFYTDILNKKHLTEEIQSILDDSWLDIKRQMNFFIISVFGTVGWYYFSCLTVNIYYTYVNPKEFQLLYRKFYLFNILFKINGFWIQKSFSSLISHVAG